MESKRYHHLDGLRAIAALLVVFHHSLTEALIGFFNGAQMSGLSHYIKYTTQSGVELFFVLSGVVLLRPYLRNKKKFELRTYFIRRFSRIWSVYLVALIFASFVIFLNTYYPTWYSSTLAKFTWESTLAQASIFSWGNNSYNGAWWSLEVELLFYCLVPFIVLFFPYFPKNNYKLFITLTLIFIISTFLQIYLNKINPYLLSQYKILKIIDYPICFIMGIYLAAYDFTLKKAFLLISGGLLLILASLFYNRFVHTGFGLLYSGLIVLSFKKSKIQTFLSKPILVWLGERSYSLFLIHFSVFYLVNYLVSYYTPGRTLEYGIATRVIGIPLAFFVTMLLFYFIERKQAKGLLTGDTFWPIRLNVNYLPSDLPIRNSSLNNKTN